MLDLIEIYGAKTVHARGLHGDERADGPGGGLLSALYHVGLGPLTARLGARPSLRSLELQDVDAGLTLRREGAAARVTMRWASGESLEDLIELAPNPDALAEGDTPLFVPDPSSRVTDLYGALGALGQALYVVEDAEGQALYAAGRYGGGPGAARLFGALPPARELGSEAFCARMGVRAPYIAGAHRGVAVVAVIAAVGHISVTVAVYVFSVFAITALIDAVIGQVQGPEVDGGVVVVAVVAAIRRAVLTVAVGVVV